MKAARVISFDQPRAPQVEDGYTRIANELFDAILGAGLPARELSVVMAIIRKTYGYNKKQDDISASQIGGLCSLARNHVTTTLKKLEAKQIIHKRSGSYGCVVGIQKDYSRWIVDASPKSGLVPNQDATSPILVLVDSPKSVHTKDNLPKDNQQKKARSGKISLRSYLEACKEKDIKPIPETDAVFKYATAAGIPDEFLRLQWMEFRDRYQEEEAPKYKAWATVFRKSVRGNWYKLWYAKDDGTYELSTTGKQAARLHGRTA